MKIIKLLDVFDYKLNLNEYRNINKVSVKYLFWKVNIVEGIELSIEMGEIKVLLVYILLFNLVVDVLCIF